MTEKFTVNERFKRLDPVEKRCFFCQNQDMENVNDSLFVPIYKPVSSLNLVVYRSVKFNKLRIGIPRCKNCREIHETSTTKSHLYGWGLALSFLALLSLMGPYGFAFGIIGAIFIGVFVQEYFCDMLTRKKDIFTMKRAGEMDESIQELVALGWSLTPPQP